jgi:alkyl sulfatase BDS1-like metallo-beta-lactamase superfamily hydrolase
MNHGLFEVVPGVYQVRGLDIANMTLIEGERGVIVVDTLTSIEGARAAMELYFCASRPAAGGRGDLYPHPYGPLGRRARRA